ncbi:MAG: hypothetical protein IJX39_07250 [Clostridia bacterium]|nr:hypothetical protein [Clostridia bacterium]
MRTYRRFGVIAPVLALFMCLLCACAGESKPVAYEDAEHTHVYGHWYDSAEEGVRVRYCKICHAEETEGKE